MPAAEVPRSKIILLNGTSSSGKSTLARALQARLNEPYLHVCIDSFEAMMPNRFGEGGVFAERSVFAKLLSGIHHAFATLAERGNNLIIDHVIIEGDEPADWLEECLTLLQPFDVFFVGVRCPLEELQRREIARGDRGSGLAEWQFPRMHRQTVYDFEVDTSEETPEECANRVLAALADFPQDGVRRTLKNLGITGRTLSTPGGERAG